MKDELRNKIKYKGFKRLLYSIKYSIDGLCYAYVHEKSLLIHALASFIAIILGFVLKISFIQWGIVFIVLGVILAIELLNTAIEAIVDMVTLEYHELAKIAKDCGSAATFVASIMGVIIGGFIYIPNFLTLIGK